jgi:hypothetical protein
MLRMNKWIVPVAGLALVLGFAQAQSRAEDPAPAPAAAADAKASVTVTVVDAEGKAVSGATVTLTAAAGHKKKSEATDPTTQPATHEKPTVVATGTTGDDGKAILAHVPDGRYHANARMKGAGRGTELVTVADGKDATVSITLKPRPAKTN